MDGGGSGFFPNPPTVPGTVGLGNWAVVVVVVVFAVVAVVLLLFTTVFFIPTAAAFRAFFTGDPCLGIIPLDGIGAADCGGGGRTCR